MDADAGSKVKEQNTQRSIDSNKIDKERAYI
jgi:hypothetical protein